MAASERFLDEVMFQETPNNYENILQRNFDNVSDNTTSYETLYENEENVDLHELQNVNYTNEPAEELAIGSTNPTDPVVPDEDTDARPKLVYIQHLHNEKYLLLEEEY